MADSDDEDISQNEKMQIQRSFNSYTPMRRWRKVSYGFDKLLFAALRFSLERNLFGVMMDNEQSRHMKKEVDYTIEYLRKQCNKHVDHQVAVHDEYSPFIKNVGDRMKEEREESMRIIRALLEYMAILAEDKTTFSEVKLPA